MSNPFIIQNSEGRSFEIQPEVLKTLDLIKTGDNQWHLLENGQAHTIELVQFDYADRSMQIRVNGEFFDLTIQDQYAQLVNKMGLSKEVVIDIKDIKAPMPGLVLKTFLKAGDTFVKGDSLLILEAMKMENILKAPTDGTISEVLVKDGDSVEKGQVLLVL